MTTEDTNKLIKEVAFDIISMTTMWGLVISSHLSFDNYYFFNEPILVYQSLYLCKDY